MSKEKKCYLAILHGVLLLCLTGTVCYSESVESQSAAEIAKLSSLVKNFKVIDLPAKAGNVKLQTSAALTVEQLRGIKLDSNPPKFTGSVPRYKKNMTDAFPAGKAPYIAQGIAPFRFKYFNNEFSYGGWRNFKMTDYAARHGFNIIFPYVRTDKEVAHLPRGTELLKWGNVSWQHWAKKHYSGTKDYLKRFDLATERDMKQMAKTAPLLHPKRISPAYKSKDIMMLDMEHPVVAPKNLSKQPWFPKSKAKQQKFIKKYYDGYAQTYIAPTKEAKKLGWKQVGIYGWQPFGRTWGGLEKATYQAGHDQAWELFGKQIYQQVDLVYNSVYSFYWSPRNVAYTLANIDLNRQIVNDQSTVKPVRPYYWPLLHGGGGGDRWWKNQPMANADMRAMITMAFFSGVDGIVCWSWSGVGSHHEKPILNSKRKFAKNSYCMVKDDFTVKAADSGAEIILKRYDVIKLLAFNQATGEVTFKKVWGANYNQSRNQVSNRQQNGPTGVANDKVLNSHLRLKSEPVAAMIEGMALIKPLEFTLRYGKVMIDVPAKQQFKQVLPIVRRVKLGKTSVIVTYDPTVVYGGKARNIVLKDFDGVKGRTLTLPADRQTRIFVLRDK
ncbi:MAG: hypothetical protein L3J71_03130 [Victivallaceae bacterium]|nr:hypothetical protein [Victivallaceae bacterium]